MYADGITQIPKLDRVDQLHLEPFCAIYANFTKKIQFKDDVTFDYPSLGMASFLFLNTDSVHDITFAVF